MFSKNCKIFQETLDMYHKVTSLLPSGRTTTQRIHNPAHRKAVYKTIKTPRPKPEADVDHSIAGGAANLIKHT
jgi:hypothetical protein